MSYHLTLEGLSVGYDGRALIKDLNIEIAAGEIVSLIGPNGSGKSTILKSIASQLLPISGRILLSGQSLKELSGEALARERAVVLTERVRTELLTGYDVAASGRYPYTRHLGTLTERDEQKVEEAMCLMNAEALGPQLFETLSDGQKQRVLFARALAQEPELLILDEPTSYLDVRYQLELLTILKRLSRERGLTIVMSLHEIGLAMRISDQLLTVRNNHAVSFGTPAELVTEDFVRELYGIEWDEVDESLRDYLGAGVKCASPLSLAGET